MHNGRKGSPGFANWQIAPLLCPHLGDGHSIIEFAMFIDRSAQTMQVHPRLVLDLIGYGSCCRVVLVISFIKSFPLLQIVKLKCCSCTLCLLVRCCISCTCHGPRSIKCVMLCLLVRCCMLNMSWTAVHHMCDVMAACCTCFWDHWHDCTIMKASAARRRACKTCKRTEDASLQDKNTTRIEA
jgi:hypothetical protein